MPKSAAPIELLKSLRVVFEYDAANYRAEEKQAMSEGERRIAGARALACEQTVRSIDATLRDWA